MVFINIFCSVVMPLTIALVNYFPILSVINIFDVAIIELGLLYGANYN
jgi:hypothetical protein